MKKSLLILVLAGMFAVSGKAQIADGTVLTENIVFTDLEGNEHDLFAYLDEGKTVIFDLFAEWCGPCWNYHNTGTGHPNGGALKTVWEDYGPDGTDEVVVFAIETDASTSEDLMYGGAGTNGWDWVTNTPYPMANANIGNIFEQAYYPFIVRICPNRQVFELGQQSATGVMSDVGDCLAASGNTNPAILSYDGTTATCGDVEVSMTIQNLGTEVLTAATFEVLVDGESDNVYEWTGSLETYETESITVHEYTATAESDLEVNITSDDEDLTSSNVEETIIFAEESTTLVTVTIELDNFPTETSWEITNQDGDVLADGGPYTNGQATQTIEEEVELPSLGCYGFEIFDSYGDGLNGAAWGGQNGEYTLTSSDGAELASGGGNDQWDSESVPFLATSALSTFDNSIDGDLAVYPNPTNSTLNVNLNLNSSQRIVLEILDVTGRVVNAKDFGTLGAGSTLYTTDLSSYEAGIYLLSISSGNAKSIKRVVVSK